MGKAGPSFCAGVPNSGRVLNTMKYNNNDKNNNNYDNVYGAVIMSARNF